MLSCSVLASRLGNQDAEKQVAESATIFSFFNFRSWQEIILPKWNIHIRLHFTFRVSEIISLNCEQNVTGDFIEQERFSFCLELHCSIRTGSVCSMFQVGESTAKWNGVLRSCWRQILLHRLNVLLCLAFLWASFHVPGGGRLCVTAHPTNIRWNFYFVAAQSIHDSIVATNTIDI